MPFSFPPCPVCGGTQAFFNGRSLSDASIQIALDSGGFFNEYIMLGALICLGCGHTELRPKRRMRHHIKYSGLFTHVDIHAKNFSLLWEGTQIDVDGCGFLLGLTDASARDFDRGSVR
jgi:hypothetical protein